MHTEIFLDGRITQICGDVREALRSLPDDHFDSVVTSPPYWGLRDYGTGRWEGGNDDCSHRPDDTPLARGIAKSTLSGGKNHTGHKHEGFKQSCPRCGAVRIDHQIGLERSLGEHLGVMVEVFREVRRVLKPSGTLWLNYGDCYATAPNGRSAADTKSAGNDDRTFRDKPFSTIGAVYVPDHELAPRTGNSSNKSNVGGDHRGRIVSADPTYQPNGNARGKFKSGDRQSRTESAGRVGGGYLKPKDLCMIPNRLAIALQDDGWWVRSEIIWHKPNPMPESTRDRPTGSHEKIWLLTKRERYFYDADAIAESAIYADSGRSSATKHELDPDRKRNGSDGNGASFRAIVETRNARNVWTIGTAPFPEAHFATFPPELAERCIKAGSPTGGHVLDIFGGSGTTGMVAASLGRACTLIELNPEYARLARARIEAAFMGREEGSRHLNNRLGRVETADALPLFGGQQ